MLGSNFTGGKLKSMMMMRIIGRCGGNIGNEGGITL